MDQYGYNSYEVDHYGYNSYESDTGEYHWTPYNYDVVPFESNFNYSSEYHEPELIENYPSINACNNFYDSSQLAINYSTYSLSNSKIGYNISSETQYLISYSTSELNVPASEFNEPAFEFNEPAFVEYDPTPYDGGYDIRTTYGKPLPPSDDICYPRTTPTSNESLDNFSYASIPSPYGKEGRVNDSPEKQIIIAEPIEVSQGGSRSGSDSETEDEDEEVAVVGLVGPIEDSNQGEITEGYTYPHYEYTYPHYEYGYPWSCYDNGYGNGRSGRYEEGCEKGVDQTTYGYGSDTIELCESLFGYWPCLSKKTARKDKHNHNHNQGFGNEVGRCSSKPWEQTADYLFGYHIDRSRY